MQCRVCGYIKYLNGVEGAEEEECETEYEYEAE